ncbi:MAG: recombinase family protein, partial [Acidobacteriota bacterium]
RRRDNDCSVADGTAAVVPAAQYVRMSTEHQQYSTENQGAVIAEYAERHGLRIVRSYADEGRSGLRINNRQALQRLISDVETGSADFRVILVYDVSRWGRFQDADESAHYEYICRRRGIRVEYCAEQFTNDGSPVATIVKGVKRAMAGEYSRELSAKVFAAHCRHVERGFRQGGSPGYGLRRVRVDINGREQGILNPGEYKNLQTDRVILKPGPPEEVDVVRRIFRMFVEDRKTEAQIAMALNAEGIPTGLSRKWVYAHVRGILTNEKYVGNNTYNLSTSKLKTRRRPNSPEKWIRKEGAFEAIVSRSQFASAQAIFAKRDHDHSDEEMLSLLSDLLRRHGRLNRDLIDRTEGMPSAKTYAIRFGSLRRAYECAGYMYARNDAGTEIMRRLRVIHRHLIGDIITMIEHCGATVRAVGPPNLLLLNEEITVAILVVRCLQTISGTWRWYVRFNVRPIPDVTVAVRMAPDNQSILDYFFFPAAVDRAPYVLLRPDNSHELDCYRFETLDPLTRMAERTGLKEAA